jgi:serine/threonine protein kinase/tetratricopeptide (TPR) repeat protein
MFAELSGSTLPDSERAALLDHAAGCRECHAALTVVTQAVPGGPTAGMRVDRYELGRIVGRGAMGVVYAARDPELDRDVAVKLLRPSASAERLRREAKALAKLAHPNVVRVYDVGDYDGQTFIAMELVDGTNLRQWLNKPHSLDDIVAVLVQAGRGLAAAHHVGLVHRDFKPDNVLLAKNGGVLVGDFGLARSADPVASATAAPYAIATTVGLSTLTATGSVVGTPAYMAPEQAAGEATAASDQYAFCVTAWEACFGQRPGPGAKPPLGAAAMRVARVLRRGMALQPEARFPSMNELLHALSPPVRRRWPWWFAVTGVAAAASIAVSLATSTSTDRVRCDTADAAIASTWTPFIEALLRGRWDASVAQGFARYAASWRQRRTDACRATYERREQTVATLEREVRCLDHARTALRDTIAVLLDPSSPVPPRPALAIASLPSLTRCDGTAAASSDPPPQSAAAVATLDTQLKRLDVALASGAPVSAATATVLRQQAESLGFAPQVLGAMVLEARVAAWSGDRVAAEAGFRRAIVVAEQSGDDFTRIHASALLAQTIADTRATEATGMVTAARAALTRVGADPAIEQALLEAEVAIATSRGDAKAAAAIHEKIIAVVRARFGDGSPALISAVGRLASLSSVAGDLTKSVAAVDRQAEMVRRSGPSEEVEKLEVMLENNTKLMANGDFEGAADLARRQLAALRRLPVRWLMNEATLANMLGSALELDRNEREAVAAYRQAESLWTRPEHEYRTAGEPDPVRIAEGVTESALGQGACLLRLGRTAEAIAQAEHALALAKAGGDATRASIGAASRLLGQALVAAGRYRQARDLLSPMTEIVARDSKLKPFPRAQALFALAQALWADGGLRDRPRALALADDAEQQLAMAIADGEANLFLRKLPAMAREELARIASWRAGRAAR